MKKHHFLFIISIILFTSCGLYRFNKYQKNFFNDQYPAQKNYREEIKFRNDGWIYIKAVLNNSEPEQEFVLDTGSPSFISFKTKDSLNIASKKLLKISGIRVDFSKIPTKIGSLYFEEANYFIMDYVLDRLLGINLMQNDILSFNFEDSIITISDNPELMEDLMKGHKIPFKPYSEQKIPVLKLIINDIDTIDAILDTGFLGFIQTNKKYKYDSIKDKNPEFVTHFYSKESEFDKVQKKKKDSNPYSSFIKTSSLKIGDYEVNNTILYSEENYDGSNLIGVEFLENFNFTIDWINSNIYLSPIEGKDFISNVSTYGFNCFVDSGKLKISIIYFDSDAFKLGLKINDEILSVNNQNLNDENVDLYKIRDEINSIKPNEKELKIKFKNIEEEFNFRKYEVFKTP
jgi:predicted aspartyl protease